MRRRRWRSCCGKWGKGETNRLSYSAGNLASTIYNAEKPKIQNKFTIKLKPIILILVYKVYKFKRKGSREKMHAS